MAEAKTLTSKETAEKIGTDARTLRRFLRKQGKGTGQGNRYALPASEVPKLKTAFQKWEKDEAAKKAAREAEKAKEPEKVAAEVQS